MKSTGEDSFLPGALNHHVLETDKGQSPLSRYHCPSTLEWCSKALSGHYPDKVNMLSLRPAKSLPGFLPRIYLGHSSTLRHFETLVDWTRARVNELSEETPRTTPGRHSAYRVRNDRRSMESCR